MYLYLERLSDHHGHSHGNGHGHGIDPAPSSVDAHVVDLPDEHEEVDAVALERTRGRNSFSVANEEQHLGDIVSKKALYRPINSF